jgi:arylsulfatase B
VMFVSDNGADPKHGGSNTPLSGGKWTTKEGGIRVPMIAKWPSRIPAGSTSTEIFHMIDLFPTMLSVAGISKPQQLTLDGCDVMECLMGKSTIAERPLFFGKNTIRKGKWKVVDSKLHDLEKDQGENHDLSAEYPEVLKELKSLGER